MSKSTPAIAGIAVLIAVLGAPSVAPAATSEDHPLHDPIPTITVTGSAEVRSAPDEAEVSLGVVAQESDARQAQRRANRIARDLLDAITGLDIEEDAVQTSQLVLTPVYESPRARPQGAVPTEPRIIAYRASNVVTVRLSDLSEIGSVIDAGIGAGANQVQGVSFHLRQDEALRERALRRATTDAASKATAIAETLGVELGPVLEAREGGVSIRQPRFRGLQAMAMETMEARGPDTPVEPGEITVSANVTLRYRIGR